MNREIIFRGKDFLKEEWVYGDLVKTKNFVAIKRTNGDYFHPTQVSPNTVGQYTGLKDKDGREIYEGDILKTPRGFIGQVVFGRAEEECRHKVFGRMVIDCYTTYGWIFVRGDGYRCAIDDELLEGEIIGNIHDNPELMKGGSNEA